jgi:GNAT superfamily N-acetyltransferase
MENITITTDKSTLNISLIHKFLSEESYWAKGISLELVARSIKNSLCFGVYDKDRQIGFARVITDYTTFAYLADVFIVSEYRRKGISKELINYIKSYPELQGLRRWVLATADAQGLYKKFGFSALSHPERFMEIRNQNIYLN